MNRSAEIDVRPMWPRALWLNWHKGRHPGHVLVGWNGFPLQCGTCIGIPEPALSRGAFWYRHRIPRLFVRITRVLPPAVTAEESA